MSQNFTDNVYQGSFSGTTVMANIENNLLCLKSMFSGGSAPSNTVAFMFWGDTGNDILKRRNAENDAWLAVLAGDASFKIPVYNNDTCEGWVIDSSVTDRVIALKGGSQAYNANGGTNAGTWVYSGLTLAHTHGINLQHNHKWLESRGTTDDDDSYDSNGSAAELTNSVNKTDDGDYAGITADVTQAPDGGNISMLGDYYTNNALSSPETTDSQSTSSVSSDGTHRIAAAVCTLQYPNV